MIHLITVFKPKRDRLYLTTTRNINKVVNKSNVNQRKKRTDATDACQDSTEITPTMPEARENMQPVPSAGRARENTQPVPSAGRAR